MTSVTSSNQIEGRSVGTSRRKRRFPAVSGVHLLIIATGVLALVTNLALLRSGDVPLTQMAVSSVNLVPGRALELQHTELTPLDAEEPVAAALISQTELPEYEGWVVTRPAAAGSLLTKTGLRAPLTTLGSRAMSLPIGTEHAVGGDLVPGDLVDVIRVDDEKAAFVATAVPVLAVSSQAEGALGLSSGGFFVVLEVDDRTALTLALALAHAEVEVLRSTGSVPVAVHRLNEEPSTNAALSSPAAGLEDFPARVPGDVSGFVPGGGGPLP